MAAARSEARQMLLDPGKALLGRAEFVIREEGLVGPALDQIMRNAESVLGGDAERLHFQLSVQADLARNEMLVSDAGLAVVSRQAAARFAAPEIKRREIATPGVKAGALEKKLGEVAGIVLSGRPAVPRDIPPERHVEIEADYGLLPAPLEKNSRAKGYVTPVRPRADDGGWLERDHPDRPHSAVVARCALDLIRQHPDAARLVLRLIVLRRMGQPVEWQFTVETEPEAGTFVIEGAGRSPGFDEKSPSLRLVISQLRELAAKAPSAPSAAPIRAP